MSLEPEVEPEHKLVIPIDKQTHEETADNHRLHLNNTSSNENIVEEEPMEPLQNRRLCKEERAKESTFDIFNVDTEKQELTKQNRVVDVDDNNFQGIRMVIELYQRSSTEHIIFKEASSDTEEEIIELDNCDLWTTENSDMDQQNLKTGRFTRFTEHQQSCTEDEISNKRITQTNRLAKKHQIHYSNKPFRCIVCFKTFERQSNYTVHLRTHNCKKSFRCEKCGIRFYSKSSFVKHKRIHTRIQCETCGKRYYRRSDYTVHLRKHTVVHTASLGVDEK